MMRIITLYSFCVLCIAAAACSTISGFDKQDLDFSTLGEVLEENLLTCSDDCDCTIMGPCNVCDRITNYCMLADDADRDGDGFLNMDCSISAVCGAERGIPEEYWPRQGDDCKDDNPDINPGMIDECNGVDDNCNGLKDEDENTFGLAFTKTIAKGYHFSICPSSDISIAAWDNAPETETVTSGFTDSTGTLLNSVVLSETGFGPAVHCFPGQGAAVAWSDRSAGNTDIMLRKVTSLGEPAGDAVHFPDDTLESRDPVIAYLEDLYMIGVAWLTHDRPVIDGPKIGKVELQVFDFFTLEPILEERIDLTPETFIIPGIPVDNPAYWVEKLSIETHDFGGEKGFALVWNQDDGIHFASLQCYREMDTTRTCDVTANTALGRETSGAQYPAFVWADGRYYLSYAVFRTDIPNIPVLKMGAIEHDGSGWALKELFFDSDAIEFEREATFPALEWVGDDFEELVLGWADSREFGKRRIRFARLMVDLEQGLLRLVTTSVIDVSDAENFAGAPQVAFKDSGASTGFVLGWTERDADNATGQVDIQTGVIRCLQLH
ncbi:MAG: putative metal-binding motif-containing protein [Pseudomonadota bacterium]